MTKWNKDNIGNQEGKVIIITGGGSGIGLAAAVALASKGAEVILAVRNIQKGNRAAAGINNTGPAVRVNVMHLDLGDLSSVSAFATQFAEHYTRLDLLVNNAGVMVPPYRLTKDNFELQFGTNHLGHFALTGLLLPMLLATPESRIVTVSSIASRGGRIDFNNLDGSKGYNPMTFYRQSKISNLLFGIELQKRLEKIGSETKSIVCHPGISATNLVSRGSGKEAGWIVKQMMKLVAQPSWMGALPTLFAALHPDLNGGEFIGPDGWKNHRGYPVITGEETELFNSELAVRLWNISEELTGVKYKGLHSEGTGESLELRA
jgi:NAD(P)-dependent dehydrogenase (short-subunit alcohol dehydrogenase family)